LEHVLAHYAVPDHGRDLISFGVTDRLVARVFLTRVLWLQGFSDQAVRTAEMSVAEAQATGHAVSLCYALAVAACPIALWVGNLAAAARHAGALFEDSRHHSLTLWNEFGSRFQIVVRLKGGDIDEGLRLLHDAAGSKPRFRFLTVGELVEALGRARRIAEGLAMVEAEIVQSEAGWLTPELLRLKGELLLMQSTEASAKTAEYLFHQAQGEAHRQGALSWELRAATSVARLLRRGRGRRSSTCVRARCRPTAPTFPAAHLGVLPSSRSKLLARLGRRQAVVFALGASKPAEMGLGLCRCRVWPLTASIFSAHQIA
jgi:hypothetical protein